MDPSPTQGQQKMSLESLSKEEIINKYKGLLGIAKKAKQSKDESLEENRKLKEQIQQYETQREADKKALMTMKEMLEAYTENKLQLTTQLCELQKHRKEDMENLEKMSIENESLKRQLSRLSEDNDSLLADIEKMEIELQEKQSKDNSVGQEQENNEMKDIIANYQKLQRKNDDLAKSMNELKEKYAFVKEVNSEQRKKFNNLKDRFLEVLKKLKKLKECKRILLETQHEYADSVSQWQMEIIKASKMLCKELNDLKLENTKLLEKLRHNLNARSVTEPSYICADKLNELLQLCEKSKIDCCLKQENMELKKLYSTLTEPPSTVGLSVTRESLDELWQLSNKALLEYNSMKESKGTNVVMADKVSPNLISILEDLSSIADKASFEYKQQSQELEVLRHNYEQMKNKITIMDEANAKLLISDDNLKQLQMHHDKLIDDGRHNNIESEFLKLKNDMDKLRLENVNLKSLTNTTPSSQTNQELESMAKLRYELLIFQKSSNEYQKLYNQKEREHYELLDEMRELNEALKARGDLISRQQEEHQLLKKEFENNTETLQRIQRKCLEKDEELTEKQRQIETFTENSEETKRKMDALENSSLLYEEKVRILQTEMEMLKSSQSNSEMDNQSEVLSTSTISKADEIQRLKDVEDTFEDKYNKIRGLAAKLKKKLQDEAGLKHQLEKDLQSLKTNEIEMKTTLEDLQSRVMEIDSLKKQISDKQIQIDSLKSENQKLKSSRKQANVLNLEIEAAEKSLTEVTNKLATRTSELDAAQGSLKTKDATIHQLRKEMELLESSKLAETKHSQELRDQIDHLQKTLKDAVHSKQQAFDKAKFLEQDVENLKLELESVKFELSTATRNLEKSLNSLKSEKEQISLELLATQGALSECEERLKHADRLTEDLRIEYLDYKVKAQAVLRKNQTRDSSKERELEEELLIAKASETQLKTASEMLSSKLAIIEKEKDNYAIDNESLQKRTKELMQIIEEIRAQNESLSEEIQQHIQQQHETLKQHRKQIESMDNCHKEHIQSMNTNHQRQLEQLSKEILPNVRLPPVVGASKSFISDFSQSVEQTKLDFLLMEREDAEGSEEATDTLATLAASRKISNASSSNAKRSQHDFMPLDELLNTPINAISSETLITAPMEISGKINSNMDFMQLELNSTKQHLQKQESRVRHLTALLAENEQDLAKLTQMNDMLKEELRRQERSVEREQHMHNSEYIKNVIMKFLTLNNADEKTRLVPVLNTILKLSRSETDMLNCVAKGQRVLDSSQRSSGWGNYLPWSGSGGSGSNNK